MRMIPQLLLLLVVLQSAVLPTSQAGPLELVILHTNDVHSRVEEFADGGGPCSANDAKDGKCFGGVARRMTVIKQIRKQYPNVLLLDAGDEFQGTPWFHYYHGMEAATFMNMLGYDAMALGQHEFDYGVKGLQKFLRNVTFPVVCCNIDSSQENETVIRDLYSKYIELEVGGEKVGIVGYNHHETQHLVDQGGVRNLVFNDVVTEINKTVAEMREKGINKIIGLGHIGFWLDRVIANTIEGLDIVVGGRTGAFLYTGDPPSTQEPVSKYPYVANATSGGQVLVVQDYKYGKYLGFLKVTFDENGTLTEWEGNPILLNSSVEQDPEVLAVVEEEKELVINFTQRVIGTTRVRLNGDRLACRTGECSMGTLMTDAMLQYYMESSPKESGSWSDVGIAMWNGGGIRRSLEPGVIRFEDIHHILPYRNTMEMCRIKGSILLQILEHSLDRWSPELPGGGFLQLSGVRMEYNMSSPKGQRTHRVKVKCTQCRYPMYVDVKKDDAYGILLSSYLISGGDGYTMLTAENFIERKYLSILGTDILADHITRRSPIGQSLESRIKFCSTQGCSATLAPKKCPASTGSRPLALYAMTIGVALAAFSNFNDV